MTKNLLILGAGTAGTMVANHLRHSLPRGWRLSVVDPEPEHLYQPGLLFLPFGARDEDQMVRPRAATLRDGVDWITSRVDRVDTDERRVLLEDGSSLPYDLLVVATGSHVRPEETEGLKEQGWYRDIFDFYTLPGALALRERLSTFAEGRLVINIVEMPIKCPVAPLEFAFLADAFFRRKGVRDRVEIVYATPLDAAFTKPVAARLLGSMLADRRIVVETEFNAGSVDPDGRVLSSWDERELPYDLLVSVPTHMGAEFIERSGLGNELGFVPTEHHSLLAKDHDDVFVLGDATDLPSSKAGSVAHFQSGVVAENVLRAIQGKSLVEGFDGHANCFVETGSGKGLLIDFNYDVEPLPGHYPLPAVGPFTLLKESRRNHLGKLGFRWAYWNLLLPARPLPVPHRMSMVGKKRPEQVAA